MDVTRFVVLNWEKRWITLNQGSRSPRDSHSDFPEDYTETTNIAAVMHEVLLIVTFYAVHFEDHHLSKYTVQQGICFKKHPVVMGCFYKRNTMTRRFQIDILIFDLRVLPSSWESTSLCSKLWQWSIPRITCQLTQTSSAAVCNLAVMK
jgi:hypothetical protein